MSLQDIREEILRLVGKYAEELNVSNRFIAGESSVPPSGKVLGGVEFTYMVDAVLDGWLTTGRFNDEFEKKFVQFLGGGFALTTTSGSSANLLALTALTSPRLKDRRLKKGDEVITVAAGFPTTVNPIIQNGLIPVFVDINLGTYNIDVAKVEQAISTRTKAIMIAHTLGNPFDLGEIKRLADAYNLWLVEDCCDALGSRYDGNIVGTYGDLATFSFYPAHHITMGEGGAVVARSSMLRSIVESFRDWGRDCFCPPGKDNTCKKRFGQKHGGLPAGYDHKYIYSHIGYNLKITDIQAACGLAQMSRLPSFIESRKNNFQYLKEKLKDFEAYLILPQETEKSEPSWFGFPITLRDECPFSRVELVSFLNDFKIGTRMLFAGNLVRQPYFKDVEYRISGDLVSTDKVMNDTFWIGVYPGLTTQHLDYVVSKFREFVEINE